MRFFFSFFKGKQNAKDGKTERTIGLKEMEAAKESDDEVSEEEDIDDDDDDDGDE